MIRGLKVVTPLKNRDSVSIARSDLVSQACKTLTEGEAGSAGGRRHHARHICGDPSSPSSGGPAATCQCRRELGKGAA